MTHAVVEVLRELHRQFRHIQLTQPRYFAAISLALALAFGVAGWAVIGASSRVISWLRRPSVRSLAEKAISGQRSEATSAARDLDRMALAGEINADLIRRVADEAQDESVRMMALVRLASLWDYEAMPLLLEMLDADSPALRRSSAKAIAKLLGRDHHFPADGTPKERSDGRQRIVKDWETYKDSKLFHVNKERLTPGMK
jgi:hypothetical protein